MAVCAHDSGSSTHSAAAHSGARISSFLGEETPTFLCGTRAGLPVALINESPHLTIPVGQLVPDIPTTLEAFAKFKSEKSNGESQPRPGLREFFALPKETKFMLTPHDVAVKLGGGHLGTANNKEITVETRSGRKKVSVDDYTKMVRSVKPDAYVAVCDSPPAGCSSNRAGKAVQRTLAWLDKCLESKGDEPSAKPLVFAAIQGGSHIRRRLLCAHESTKREVDGYVIDDLQSEAPESRLSLIENIMTELSDGRLRMASGLSDPVEILGAISLGVDMFDLTFAEVLSENGRVAVFKFDVSSEEKTTSDGKQPLYFDVQDKRYVLDDSPLAEGFESETSVRHTKAYLCHIVKTEPLNALILLYSHNTYVLRKFFDDVRQSIKDGSFEEKRAAFVSHYERHDHSMLVRPKRKKSSFSDLEAKKSETS